MRKESTESRSESRPEWEQLEDWVRSQVQRLIQELLEEEVTAFLGRAKSALRSDSDSDTGYRNGYGRARRLTLSSGTIQLRRPRVRDTEEQFESRLLPLFVNRTRKVAELIPELYLHGLSEGDFDLALRGLLGEDAPVSASTVARLKSKWNDELAQWRSRPLDDLEVVYMWVDGVYVKAGLEKEKAAVLVVMAALSDGSKVVVSAVPGYRESTENVGVQQSRGGAGHMATSYVNAQRNHGRQAHGKATYQHEGWLPDPVESPFAALRLRTDAAKRYKRVDRAIAVIWKMLMVQVRRRDQGIESTAEKVAA